MSKKSVRHILGLLGGKDSTGLAVVLSSGVVKMSEFYLRTESIQLDKIQDLFVSTRQDREIIDSLKSSDSVILEGSRGTGKSFLIRMAEVELENCFTVDRILPVYVTFVASSLIHTNDPEQFKHWMLASTATLETKA